MKYLVVIRKSKYGYDIHVPALPGCHSQGETQKEEKRAWQKDVPVSPNRRRPIHIRYVGRRANGLVDDELVLLLEGGA